jgi:hypothetical protein
MSPQQLTWTYVSDAGNRYVVGLFHSLREGHLMVHCNKEVVLVDFKVFETRKYPLFIDDELFQITIERKGNRFSYGFEIDKKADTPRNKWRRKLEQKHWKQTLLFVALLTLAVGTFTYLFLSYQKPSKADEAIAAELLQYHGKETQGQVDLVYEVEGKARLRYVFEAQGQAQSGQLSLSEAAAIAETGWPLQKGDQFAVRYVSDNPKLNTLLLQKPSEKQQEQYREQALLQHLELHPELTEQYTNCLLDIAFRQKGIQGWADFRYQEEPETANPYANKLTYLRLVRHPDFQDAVDSECWD